MAAVLVHSPADSPGWNIVLSLRVIRVFFGEAVRQP